MATRSRTTPTSGRSIKIIMLLEPLTAVSSVDGRYRATAEALAEYFSEYALIKMRLIVECEYLIALSETKGRRDASAYCGREDDASCAAAYRRSKMHRSVKKIEREGYGGIPATNHDVKAVEYFIKLKLKELEPRRRTRVGALRAHLGGREQRRPCPRTSRSARRCHAVRRSRRCRMRSSRLARAHADTAMLARTHGQSATPTTFGKEMNVFAKRLEKQVDDPQEQHHPGEVGRPIGQLQRSDGGPSAGGLAWLLRVLLRRAECGRRGQERISYASSSTR